MQTIRNHDIITFKHTQNGGYLTVGPAKPGDSLAGSQKNEGLFSGLVGKSKGMEEEKYPILRELEDN